MNQSLFSLGQFSLGQSFFGQSRAGSSLPFLRAKRRRSVGFSLLELLVVISIIAILIAVAAAAYSTAQKKARDARRRGDVKAMQDAFEQYYAQNDSSYEACATMATDFMQGGLPVDPKGDAYPCTGAATSYCICSTALDTGGGNADLTDCTDISTADSAKTRYCVKNLQ